eukprot:914372-Amorphochlora_amoeboformis.AAC.1
MPVAIPNALRSRRSMKTTSNQEKVSNGANSTASKKRPTETKQLGSRAPLQAAIRENFNEKVGEDDVRQPGGSSGLGVDRDGDGFDLMAEVDRKKSMK